MKMVALEIGFLLSLRRTPSIRWFFPLIRVKNNQSKHILFERYLEEFYWYKLMQDGNLLIAVFWMSSSIDHVQLV